MDHVSDEMDVDDRREVERVVAAGIASLSGSPSRPTEVEQTEEFTDQDVRFEDGSWLDLVAAVQDWLRLDVRLDPLAPTERLARMLFDGLGTNVPHEMFTVLDDVVALTPQGLDLLRTRVERAVNLRDAFLEALDGGSRSGATATWVEAWDDTVDTTVSGPIRAKAEVWSIHDFASRAKSRRLELSPSYQRGDVWPTGDSQLLIESILRGIPLPSVIILRPKSAAEAPFEVVDGKQRLTSILRFIGAHPAAIEIVESAAREYPGFELASLFRTDYPRFRSAWKKATGETLTTTTERSYYFPFKLAAGSRGLSGDLTTLAGKYFHQIADEFVQVGGEHVAVRDIFESTTDYKVPVIEYTEATPRQIHEVFSLYNKQGKHLNAEEIRNAVYHELDLMRALSVSAGDGPGIRAVAPFLAPVSADVSAIATFLADAAVPDSRYRRTKVLSWLFSTLFLDSLNDDGEPRRLSTANQINSLLDRAQRPGDPMRDGRVISDALRLVATAMRAHRAADAWSDHFKDGKSGARWHDLQLVASLSGVCLATAVLGDQVVDELRRHEGALRALSAAEWARPSKTQTSVQWSHIAKVAMGILRTLDIDPEVADRALRDGYGFSAARALLLIADGED